ncbi:MAG: magnesium transporter CorA family protein [Candidatus Wallbacteria bacterium]|nr:magnesium transporter CorA family protein [Candidatus Wallbacteria bacterium]
MLRILKTNDAELVEIDLEKICPEVWINLEAPRTEEMTSVSLKTGIGFDILRAALDPEESSRVEIQDNCILVIINTPKIMGSDRYDTVPLGIIVSENFMITVCLEENELLREFLNSKIKHFWTDKKTRFLFQLLLKCATMFLKLLTQINRRTDELERNLRRSMRNEEIYQLMELEKSLTYFTASLRGNQIVTEKLLKLRANEQFTLLQAFEEDDEILEDVVVENRQALEMVQMYGDVLSGMMDAFASVISNNLNIVMKFLTMVTICIAIPTMISSFWGMNVNVPWGVNTTGHPFGFWFVAGLSGVLFLFSLYVFWKKGMFK